jgi:hypothetical protein
MPASLPPSPWRFCSLFFFILQFLYQVLSFGMIVSSALMIWKGLMVVTGSESPIVVVLRSGKTFLFISACKHACLQH